ncbi:MAG: GNAT family N-acetyltransferase [Betaproteobacteria bacterium]
MMVRPVRIADLDAVVELARNSFEESRFQGLPFDETRVRQKVARMVNEPRSDHYFCGAFTHGGKIAGYMVGAVEQYFFCEHTVATSVFLFVDPQERGGLAALKLILAFRSWAKNRQASEMYIGVASGVLVQRTGRFLQRLGLKFTGGNYSMWLDR